MSDGYLQLVIPDGPFVDHRDPTLADILEWLSVELSIPVDELRAALGVSDE